MADRFWRGGTGNWSDNTNHWATSSGGAGGASLPTSSDNVFIDANSGFGAGGTISLDATENCNNFTANSGHSYTIAENQVINVYGSLTLESGITLTSLPQFQLVATTTGKTITTGGVIFASNYLVFSGVGGGWTLQDNLTTTGQFYIDAGTFNANNYNITANDFEFFANTGYTPTVIMGSGTWTATGNDITTGQTWFISEFSGQVVTITPNTSTIKFTDATTNFKTFLDIGKIYYNIWLTGAGTGNFIINGAPTFNNLKVDTPPHTILFESETIITVTTFTVSGTAGNLITIGSTSDISHTLTKSGGGTISSDYLSISYSTATPGTTWYAGTHSTDGGNNSGWIFTAIPTPSAWTNQTKNSTNFSNQSKNSSSFSNQTKNTTIFSNQSKNITTFSNQNKNTTTFSNQTKN